MKKVVIAHFTTESNENIPQRAELKDYTLLFGDRVGEEMHIKDIFEENDVQCIPAVYANSGGSGLVSQDAFQYILHQITKTVKENLKEIDGIFLFLHGASYVEETGSGDHIILNEIRRITGPYMPVAVVCDPHGNLNEEYVHQCTILKTFRESPHTDNIATHRLVARQFCDLLNNRRNIHAIYRKLPLILGGEQSVSKDEPVRSINAYMDEMEKDPRILDVSWHVGYIRHDTENAGCGLVIVPNDESDIDYCENKIDELKAFVWEKRHEFHYTCNAEEPEDALRHALAYEGKPVIISDSGDNVTSGSGGWNTYVLRQFLQVENLQKKVLIANICDPQSYERLNKLETGTHVQIDLGIGFDTLSEPVSLNVEVLAKGTLEYYLDHYADYGYSVLVHITDTNIYVNVGSTRQTMAEKNQFEHAGINWDDYDIIVVKQGYIFPELMEKGELCIMSLTDGATLQDTSHLKLKRIMRPMYPIDNI